jgi:hypothetical protein
MNKLINLADLIRRQHANAKFWFISWKKDRDFALMTKIRDAIAVLKDLLGKVNSSTDHEDRVMAAAVRKEVEEMESVISKTPVFTSSK